MTIDAEVSRIVRAVLREELERVAADIVRRLAPLRLTPPNAVPSPAPAQANDDETLSIGEFARGIGVQAATVRRCVARGLVRSLGVGANGSRRPNVLLPRSELERLLARGRGDGGVR